MCEGTYVRGSVAFRAGQVFVLTIHVITGRKNGKYLRHMPLHPYIRRLIGHGQGEDVLLVLQAFEQGHDL